jgi:2-desacetyl-2-hydroxyethyl bacteriochlorophyllide A dehydrogenase
MRALWLENQTLTYRMDLSIPKPESDQALVRVRMAGICSTDLELVRGYYPYTGIPGHEFVGEVVEAAQSPHWIGRRVVAEINTSCGKCETCQRGDISHCERRIVLGIRGLDGAFAEYLRIPVKNLHLLSENIPDEAAVFTELLAAALEIQQQVHIRPSEQVLVLGAGRLGQLVAQTLALRGCHLRVVARRPNQRQLLEEQGIAVIQPEEIPTRRLDVVIDTTGSPDGFALARQAVRPRGTIVLKSTYKGELSFNLSTVVVDEITLIGSRCGPFPPALNLLAEGLINPTPLIEARYSLQDGLAAFDHAAQPGALKVLIVPT